MLKRRMRSLVPFEERAMRASPSLMGSTVATRVRGMAVRANAAMEKAVMG